MSDNTTIEKCPLINCKYIFFVSLFHRPRRPLGRVEVYLYSILDLCARRGWGVSVTPRQHLTPGKDPVPIVQEAGWASGPVWTAAENLAPPGFDPRTVQSLGSRYTDYATRPTLYHICPIKLNKWPLACTDCGFEYRRRHGGLSVVSVVCCQVEVSATSWSLVQRSPTKCDASLCVI